MNPGLAAVREMACGRFWPLIALTLVGWMAVISSDHVLMLPGICAPGMSKLWFLGSVGLAATLQFNPIDGLLLSWVPMQIAMMSPLLRVPLAHIWNRSLYGRRRRGFFVYNGVCQHVDRNACGSDPVFGHPAHGGRKQPNPPVFDCIGHGGEYSREALRGSAL